MLGNLRGVVLPGGTDIEYPIDGQNGGVGKKVNGALSQGFVNGRQLQIVAELDGAGNVVARFVYADRANMPSYMVKGGTTYRIIADRLGNPRLIVNASDGCAAHRLRRLWTRSQRYGSRVQVVQVPSRAGP